MGLMISSDVFQARMSRIFEEVSLLCLIVYLDNILLFTKGNFSDHLQKLEQVFIILDRNNLHVHVEETFLAAQEVNYLGYTLTTQGIKPQIAKIYPILRLAPPVSRKQLRAFLGFINHYKVLWHKRSHLAYPLTQLTSTKTTFKWLPAHQEAFVKLKNLVARQVLLRYPDFSKPFKLYTDASDYQLGSVIVQLFNDTEYPIAFYSRALTQAQKNYTTIEKELLSIVESCLKFRHILLGFPLAILSDHRNLRFENFSSERVRRWRLLLEEFDYTFHYYPGKDNHIADMISRYPIISLDSSNIAEMNTPLDDIDNNTFPLDFKYIAQHQRQDNELQQKLKSAPTLFTRSQITSGTTLIFRDSKIVVPTALHDKIIQWYHDTLNHPGIQRTVNTIRQHFWIKNLVPKVTSHISNCPICSRIKRNQRNYGHLPVSPLATNPPQPWETIQVDLFGPWTWTDCNGIDRSIRAVSIIDVATRWIELAPYSDRQSESISIIIDHQWLCRYPRSQFCIFDNGPEFTSHFIELLVSYGITPRPTTIKNPQANGIVERIHQTIADAIRSMRLDQQPFDETTIPAVLQAVAWGIRSTYHTALQASPAQIVFGRDMIINATYLANWHKSTAHQRSRALQNNLNENAKRIQHDYQPNDMVYLTDKDVKRKLDVKQGPFRIVSIHTNGTVTIQRSPTVTERINIRRLHPAPAT
mmetsp:Transcript_13570/g.16453  ORF Transcript_13570/g.16453 Transcript_13570/m.16453 type:complete len:698 (+) Transcript_13570:1112-3205(+)